MRHKSNSVSENTESETQQEESPLCSAFENWWSDQDNGCPALVLDNDEEFARAVWVAAIDWAASQCEDVGIKQHSHDGVYAAGKKAGAFVCRDILLKNTKACLDIHKHS